MTDPRHKRYFAGCYNCTFLERFALVDFCNKHEGIEYTNYSSGENNTYEEGQDSVIYICNDWKKKETGNVPPTYFMNGF